MESAARESLRRIFLEAVAAVASGAALRRALRPGAGGLDLAGEWIRPGGGLSLLAVGKAAAPMAQALAEAAGDLLRAGLCIPPRGQGLALPRIRVVEGSHPLPDAGSVRAGRAALDFVGQRPRDETLAVLLSGGASALMCLPLEGLSLEDLAHTTALLLQAGADIEELNSVRKHLSAVAGGKLARAATAARVVVLAISDVAGDRWDLIGSGPFAGDPSGFADEVEVLRRRGAWAAARPAVRQVLEHGAAGQRDENPAPGSPELARVRCRILANNRTALDAAASCARRLGLRPVRVTERLAGEARVAGRRLAALARSTRPDAPTCLLAGGETVVRVGGSGRGGRSQELALAAAMGLAGLPQVALLAAGTDGSDGPTPAAGALCDGGTLARGRAAGIDAARALAENDSHGFFRAEGGLVETGPTGTNVRDLVLLALPGPAPASASRG